MAHAASTVDGFDEWAVSVEKIVGAPLADLVLRRNAGSRVPVIDAGEHDRIRNWLQRQQRSLTADPRPALEIRMGVARLYLVLLAAGLWQGDEGWRDDLKEVACELVPSDEEDRTHAAEVVTSACTLIAECLALLRRDARLHGSTAADRTFKHAWERTKELAIFADLDLLDGELLDADQPFAVAASETDIVAITELAADADDDPHADMLDAFQSDGLPVTYEDGVWLVDGEFRSPRAKAAYVATKVGAPCAVLARNSRKAAVVLFHDGVLAFAESPIQQWRLHKLPPIATPSSVLGDDMSAFRERYPLLPIPDRVRDLAAASDANPQMLAIAIKMSGS
ncbi:hypothetical protein [Antrihabitans sp. YC2-6]|uniref:hypothetical protein n=1 Tax=Antrihabitans sp. YC2-6 TaxID=2799498 RepID=UPI0018F34BB2|nr:hypothetical protein [Antrihabitans sp. YC2-6]MBJ8348054.1 hypothetical protein [Antrihabitans sp. YC2-6]